MAKAKFTNKKTLNAQEQYEQALAKLKAARSKLNRIRGQGCPTDRRTRYGTVSP